MSSGKLKKFVSDNRPAFDSDEPGKDLWNKIDARLQNKATSRFSSSWLSRFKYLAFYASFLVVGIYFIAKKLHFSLEKQATKIENNLKALTSGKDQPIPQNSESSGEATQVKKSGILTDADQSNHSETFKTCTEITGKDSLLKQEKEIHTNFVAGAINTPSEKSHSENPSQVFSSEAEITSVNSAYEKKENGLTKTKKPDLYIPEEVEKINTYTGTIYESSSFCSLLRAYKFPGRVKLNDGEIRRDVDRKRRVLRTTNCSRIADIPNIKAVWLKGRSDKKVMLSVEKRFKNILLLKKDGRKLYPEAISHYYKGLGVISEYTGKTLNIFYGNKVELILFFKDVEEGDRVLIDGYIEAVVKNQP